MLKNKTKNYNAYLSRMEDLLKQIDNYTTEIKNFISDNGDIAETFRHKIFRYKRHCKKHDAGDEKCAQ